MQKLGFISKIIFLVNSIVALALLLSYTLPFIPPKSFALLSVLSLGVPILIVSNILFLIYWLIRFKKQLLLSLIVLLVGYFIFGSLYKFSSKNENVATSITIMNYNVRLFNLYEWIPQKDVELKIENLIKSESPDILSLQEYHPHQNIDLSFFEYKYEKLSGNKTKYGQAIFSKFPIINSGSIEFPDTSNNAIFADIVKDEDTMRVYNIHLQSMHINVNVDSLKKENSERLLKHIGKTFTMQQSQAELFLKHKSQSPYKMIICGDFNNTAFSYVYKIVKGNLKDTFKEAGSGFGSTYDFKFFPIRIDYIFADEAFHVNHFETYNEKYSDHHPIKASISLHK